MANKKKKSLIERYTDNQSYVGKTAKKISNAVGGKGITDYAAGKGTKKGALKSAAVVGLTVGTGAAGLGRKAIAKGVTKTVAKRKAVKKSATLRKRRAAESSGDLRRRRYEGEARRAAKKRVKGKKK